MVVVVAEVVVVVVVEVVVVVGLVVVVVVAVVVGLQTGQHCPGLNPSMMQFSGVSHCSVTQSISPVGKQVQLTQGSSSS